MRMTDIAGANAQAIRLKGVSKTYGTVVALAPLDLTVPAGSLVALLGPSGCGKSTTLRITAGLEVPDQGQVFLGDQDITDTPCNRRRLGLVFQNYALFPHMTVWNNVSFGLRMLGLERDQIRQRTHEALDLVQLSEYGDRFPSMLSGGQQQRVALARTLIMRPKALLLDEPLGALDKNLRESMQFELRRLQRSLGITTVLVTHDQEEALTLSDRVVVMNEGRIVQSGTPREVYDQPQTRFVAEFLGTANIFVCAPVGDGRLARIVGVTEVSGTAVSVPIAGLDLAQSQERFLFAVRPERITVSTESPPADTASLRGTVRGHIFRGDNHLFEVEVPGLATVVYAQHQHANTEALASTGDSVYLSWAPESGVVLSDRVAA
jgi:spermidine/putrescine ABC transporter ATP-binding subunit